MNNNIPRPKKASSAELAKLLTAQHSLIYELNRANAVPTVAKIVGEMRFRARYYLLAIA